MVGKNAATCASPSGIVVRSSFEIGQRVIVRPHGWMKKPESMAHVTSGQYEFVEDSKIRFECIQARERKIATRGQFWILHEGGPGMEPWLDSEGVLHLFGCSNTDASE